MRTGIWFLVLLALPSNGLLVWAQGTSLFRQRLATDEAKTPFKLDELACRLTSKAAVREQSRKEARRVTVVGSVFNQQAR